MVTTENIDEKRENQQLVYWIIPVDEEMMNYCGSDAFETNKLIEKSVQFVETDIVDSAENIAPNDQIFKAK